jgi:hypothetical protein
MKKTTETVVVIVIKFTVCLLKEERGVRCGRRGRTRKKNKQVIYFFYFFFITLIMI